MRLVVVTIIVTMTLMLFIVSCEPMKKLSNEDNLTTYVTKSCGTEPAFANAYWNNTAPGIYVDANTGEALFSSLDKFDSGNGWPSFSRPISNTTIQQKNDTSYGMERIEVHTNASHLGHIFDDGPNGTSHYCINSAALRFIPYAELDAQGYTKYKNMFNYETATFAGGCFWGVQYLLENTNGVVSTRAGYTGGTIVNPSYEDVSSGSTYHAEAVEVIYDPTKISYSQLLDYFWRLHNPTELNMQGPDVGEQYRSAIFYHNEEQKEIALASKAAFDAKKIFPAKAVTQIVAAGSFYQAEDYHQNYVDKHPGYVCHALRKE